MRTTKIIALLMLASAIISVFLSGFAEAPELVCLLCVIGILMAAGSYVIAEYGDYNEEEYIQQEVAERVRNELAAREEKRRAVSEQLHNWRWWEV